MPLAVIFDSISVDIMVKSGAIITGGPYSTKYYDDYLLFIIDFIRKLINLSCMYNNNTKRNIRNKRAWRDKRNDLKYRNHRFNKLIY